jgi:chromosomal replication initiation ATPase DnaA
MNPIALAELQKLNGNLHQLTKRIAELCDALAPVVKQDAGGWKSKPVRLREIVEKACVTLGVDLEDVMSDSRVHSVCLVRFIAYTIAQDNLGMSQVAIGKFFDRCPTGVASGIDRLKDLSANDREAREAARAVREAVKHLIETKES